MNVKTQEMRFEGRTAIVTGAGSGLGRAYALELARRGAAVLVNDLEAGAARAVAEEVSARGCRSLAVGGSVVDLDTAAAMVDAARTAWGRIDILINNAGILRDKSFAKMTVEDFRQVLDVHVMGTVLACKAVWPHMVSQGHGRILITTSSAGLFGNFGQSNYGTAKMALVGLMQTLGIEGQKHGIHVNSLAPTAATRMTEGILDAAMRERLSPDLVLPAMLVLTHDTAPNRIIFCAGGGSFEAATVTLSQGIRLAPGPDMAEILQARLADVLDRTRHLTPQNAFGQVDHELAKALG